jgi:hypothetical protein
MAYNPSGFQLTHLLQDVWYRMGQLRTWTITNGSATTVINTLWAGVEEPIFEDDDPSLIYGTVVVVKDAANAAPEGEMGMITDYDSSSQTITMETLTAAVASGDKVGIASPLFPFQDMLRLANIAIQKLGDVMVPDTSISIVAGQSEYLLPATIRSKPISVRRQTVQDANDNRWVPVEGWDVIPQAVGSQLKLTLPAIPVNYSLEIIYRGLHPDVTAFDSEILGLIHPELAACSLIAEAFQWYNNQVGGSNQYFLQRENKAIQDLESALVRYPIDDNVGQVQGFPHWGKSGDYVPLTSDLRA